MTKKFFDETDYSTYFTARQTRIARKGQTRMLVNLFVWQFDTCITRLSIIWMRVNGRVMKIGANTAFLKIRPEPVAQLWIFDANYIKMPSAFCPITWQNNFLNILQLLPIPPGGPPPFGNE